jgi:hypothetical protein
MPINFSISSIKGVFSVNLSITIEHPKTVPYTNIKGYNVFLMIPLKKTIVAKSQIA